MPQNQTNNNPNETEPELTSATSTAATPQNDNSGLLLQEGEEEIHSSAANNSSPFQDQIEDSEPVTDDLEAGISQRDPNALPEPQDEPPVQQQQNPNTEGTNTPFPENSPLMPNQKAAAASAGPMSTTSVRIGSKQRKKRNSIAQKSKIPESQQQQQLQISGKSQDKSAAASNLTNTATSSNNYRKRNPASQNTNPTHRNRTVPRNAIMEVMPTYQKPIKKQAVQLPQFDFQGLPSLPKHDEITGDPIPYAERTRMINEGFGATHNRRLNSQLGSRRRTTTDATAPVHPQDNQLHEFQQQPSKRTKYRTLTRELILSVSMCSSPSEVMELFLSNKRLNDIDEYCLREFSNVYLIELGDNWQIPMWKLRQLPQLRELHLPCNSLEYVSFQDLEQVMEQQRQQYEQEQLANSRSSEPHPDHEAHTYEEELENRAWKSEETRQAEQPYSAAHDEYSQQQQQQQHHHHVSLPKPRKSLLDASPIFPSLETLNLSHNHLSIDVYGLFYQLSLLPSLKRLNLASNEFTQLPEDLSDLRQLAFLSVEGNHLTEEAFYSLSTIPRLEKLNASRNRIRRVPQFGVPMQHPYHDEHDVQEEMHLDTSAAYSEYQQQQMNCPIVFPSLKMLSIGENFVAYHQDLYNLLQFHCLEQIFIWDNPVCDSTRELELVTEELGAKDIQIILNGPIPPPTKDLSVRNFYNHKLKTIRSYEHVTRKRKPKKNRNKETSSAPSRSSSSFFITDTQIEEQPESEDAGVHVPNITAHPNTPGAYSVASTQYHADSSLQSTHGAGTEFDRSTAASNKKSKKHPRRSTNGDYNADWFKLDSVLNKLSVDQHDPYYMDDHSMSMRVSSKPSKTTKLALKDLKFALDHPLKTIDDRYLRTRFAMNTKNLRHERKKARDDNVDRFYRNSSSGGGSSRVGGGSLGR